MTSGDDLSEQTLSNISVEVRSAQKPFVLPLSRFVYEYKELPKSSSLAWLWITLAVVLVAAVGVVIYFKFVKARAASKAQHELDTLEKGEYTMIGNRSENITNNEDESASLRKKKE